MRTKQKELALEQCKKALSALLKDAKNESEVIRTVGDFFEVTTSVCSDVLDHKLMVKAVKAIIALEGK
jgi:chaperonin cofactor prefoldin